MSPKQFSYIAFIVAIAFLIFSCNKEVEGPGGGASFDCNQLSYADTIYYISATQSVLVSPQNNLEGEGTFEVSPEGLAIDPNTGVIDVNASETGLKYKITFIPNGSTQACETFVTIGGVNYLDGIYVLDQNETLAGPVYNGVPGLPLPCPDDDSDDGSDDNSCDFDVENPTGQLLEDLGFEISSKGVFDLLETVENGTFGSVPVNGESLDVELYYQLPDLSANALNSIPLRFFYYETVADIPQALLDDIEEKSDLINESRSGNSFNFRVLNETRPRRSPRPPFIVIVARLE
ncbi:hypothetical protein [Algoriphagus limi]|uniref:Uncharacterized protein n=1 Tax=Algoriphagus limi TaxID=2975273 RepID=A0ABT2G2D5_9BACT|nr:hypothetical protein [Algoriphagus limi]MCS5489237.1 hypothetical protein [Algoriphagus limi]